MCKGLEVLISVSLCQSTKPCLTTPSADVKGEYRLTYTATDTAQNQAQLVVVVEVIDPTEPEIKLNGPVDMTTEAGQAFIDPFGTITDLIEGDLTADLASDAATAVNTNVLGVYTVTYYMTKADKQGLLAFNVTRIVRVVDRIKPVSLTVVLLCLL
jgi:hypothetical protein